MRRGTWIAQFGIVGRADAADEDFHIAFLVGNAQPRNRLLQLAQFNDAVLAQLVRTQRLDDAGHVLRFCSRRLAVTMMSPAPSLAGVPAAGFAADCPAGASCATAGAAAQVESSASTMLRFQIPLLIYSSPDWMVFE
jgi:hypothetical protein